MLIDSFWFLFLGWIVTFEGKHNYNPNILLISLVGVLQGSRWNIDSSMQCGSYLDIVEKQNDTLTTIVQSCFKRDFFLTS